MRQDLAVIEGTVVGLAPQSVREVDPRQWDADAAWDAAVGFWLKSVGSQHSRDAYKRDIAMWRGYCRSKGVPLDDARRGDVEDWRDEMAGTPATVARRLSAVSSFYRYWHGEDMVARNPAQNATRPKVSSAPKSISLTLHQSADLMAYINGLADLRPGVIFRMLAETGMRVGELTGAQVSDLGMSGGNYTIRLTRKGSEDGELMALAATTYHRVMTYIDGRRDGYILQVARTERRSADSDGRMDRSYVRRLLRRISREAGLPEAVCDKMHPHVLRHSLATILAADKVPVHEIQRVLGHADLRTTQRYIHHQKGLDASPVYRMAQLLSE